jgi:hypothetical protein
MNGNRHSLLQSCTTLMAMVALVLLCAVVSHAQVALDQLTTQTLDTTTGLVVDASKVGKPKPKVSVPELSASVLLLMGLGVSGLVGFYVERRKRSA